MKSTLLAVGAALSVVGAAHGADPVAGSIGTSAGAPTRSFGAIPGMPGAGAVAPSFGALPGAPGSPTYQPFSALPSLGNQGTPVAPEPGTSAAGFNAPNSSSGAEASGGSLGSTGTAGSNGGG
jgi:hypothetical protein